MKITRPIKTDGTAVKPAIGEKQIEALIEKGGSSVTVERTASNDDETQQVRLIAYRSQLNDIEEALSKMPKRGRPSRHAWILQAIDEKIEREKKKRK